MALTHRHCAQPSLLQRDDALPELLLTSWPREGTWQWRQCGWHARPESSGRAAGRQSDSNELRKRHRDRQAQKHRGGGGGRESARRRESARARARVCVCVCVCVCVPSCTTCGCARCHRRACAAVPHRCREHAAASNGAHRAAARVTTRTATCCTTARRGASAELASTTGGR